MIKVSILFRVEDCFSAKPYFCFRWPRGLYMYFGWLWFMWNVSVWWEPTQEGGGDATS